MKKITLLVLVVAVMLVSSCGYFEQSYDSANYESLSNEKGDIILVSGGVEFKSFEDIKITYSSAESQALFFKDSKGKKYYWQGDALIKLD